MYEEGEMLVIRIGICDDIDSECQLVYNLCEVYFKEEKIEHEYTFFKKGEDVLLYCEEGNERIDLLFLDIEMTGINGIELKDAVLKKNEIWRIAFVSGHDDSIYGTFSQKTIGFISKPATADRIVKTIKIVIDELRENVSISIRDLNGNIKNINIDDVLYLKAAGSYTEIFTYSNFDQENKYIITTRKIGDWEKDLKDFSVVRVHKSYMVNLQNVLDINQRITLRDILIELPIGRAYKEVVRKKYLELGKNIIRKRLC